MKVTARPWRYPMTLLAFAAMMGIGAAAELNPAAVIYKLPDQIPWGPVNAAGAQIAVVVGDPAKPGLVGSPTTTALCAPAALTGPQGIWSGSL